MSFVNKRNADRSADDVTFSDALNVFVTWTIIMAVICVYTHCESITGYKGFSRYTPPFTSTPLRTAPAQLGVEYRNVAESIYDGTGYANPFSDSTGPTAWVAPLLTLLMAAVLWIGGGSYTVLIIAFYVCQVLVIASIATATTLIGRRLGCRWTATIAVAAVCMVDFHFLFQASHDGVFLAGWVLLIALFDCVRKKGSDRTLSHRQAVLWGGIGGLSALSSPILALDWIVLTALRRRDWRFRQCCLSVIVAGVIIMPWVARNAVVFGQFIPVKSNAAFELVQGMIDEPTGVVTMRSMTGTHPYHSFTQHGVRYRTLGEAAFADEMKSVAIERLTQEAPSYAAGALNRLLAATVDLPQMIPHLESSTYHRVSQILYPLAFLGWVWSLYSPPKRLTSLVRSFQVLYPVHLLPFVLVSFYGRYAVPLLLLRAFFTMYFLSRVADCVGRVFRRILKATEGQI